MPFALRPPVAFVAPNNFEGFSAWFAVGRGFEINRHRHNPGLNLAVKVPLVPASVVGILSVIPVEGCVPAVCNCECQREAKAMHWTNAILVENRFHVERGAHVR